MKASSESGLWATRMVRGGALGFLKNGERGTVSGKRGFPLELLDGRLVLQVLDSLGPHLRVVVRQEVAPRAGAARRCRSEAGRLAPHHVTEQVGRDRGEDGIGQGQRAGSVAALQMEHRRMISGVDVDRVELGVGPERHRQEALNLRRVALVGRLHDTVEEAVESLARASSG